MDLKNKIAIVTGAASGLGEAIARRYVASGARVAIADLRLDAAQKTAEALSAEGPGTALGIAMDVADEAQVNAGVAQVIETWGGIDIAVANAGIQIVSPIVEFSFADWKRLLAIHLDGAFLLTKAAWPSMLARGGGSFIYMGSVHSKLASPLKSAYVAAKHGLLGFARTVSKEGGPHRIRANVICPGFVRTPLVERQIPEQAKELGLSEEQVVKEIMLGGTVDKEFTTPQDVAEVAHLFAAFPTDALTGQSLVVSHGWYMN